MATVTDLPTLNAGAQVPCGHTSWTNLAPTEGHHEECRCHGTGWVYVLDADDKLGLRVPCPGTEHNLSSNPPFDTAMRCWIRRSWADDIQLLSCGGLGWTPNPDGWGEAAVKVGASVFRVWWNRIEKCWAAEVRLVASHLPSSVATGETPNEAFHTALHRALEAMGARFGIPASAPAQVSVSPVDGP